MGKYDWSRLGGNLGDTEARELRIRGLFGNAVDHGNLGWSWAVSRHGKWGQKFTKLAGGDARDLADARRKVDNWERSQKGKIKG